MTILGSLFVTLLTIMVMLIYVGIYLRILKDKQDPTIILTLGIPISVFMVYNLIDMWIATFELIALRGG